MEPPGWAFFLLALLVPPRAAVSAAIPARHVMLVQRSIRVQAAPVRNISQVSNITGLQANLSQTSSHQASEAWRRRIEAGAEPGSVERSFVASLGEQIEEELLLELHSSDTAALRSKVLLTVVEMLGFGICGVDRCLMGQGCLGVLKGVTAGGLLVWALLDFVLVVACSLSFSDHLKGLGYNVTFESSTVTASFWLCLVLLVAQLLSACRLWRNMSDRYADVESEQEAAKPEGAAQGWAAAAAPAAAPPAAGVPDAQAATRPGSAGSAAKTGPLRAFLVRVGLGCSGAEEPAPRGTRYGRRQASAAAGSGEPGEAAAGPAPSGPAGPCT